MRDSRLHAGGLGDGAFRLPAAAARASARPSDHGDRGVDHPAAPRHAGVDAQRHRLPADHGEQGAPLRRRHDHQRADRDSRAVPDDHGRARAAGLSHAPRHGDARHGAEPAGGGPDGDRHQPRHRRHFPDWRRARCGGRRHGRHLLRCRAVHHGLDPRPEGLRRGCSRRHRQHSRRHGGRAAARRGRSARRGLHRRPHRPVRRRRLVRLVDPALRGGPALHPVRLELPGRVRVRGADPRAAGAALRPPRRARGRSRLKPAAPARVWAATAIVAIALLLLPFALSYAGTAWVRIANFAILYVLLALGLNIVVGFAGLLDLGYIAFYAVGAYVYALLASPHFGVHLPFWIILPIGAAVAGLFGVLLGAPTLKLRGDYLAIVTLGFGEIVRIFLNNLSQPLNITNGPQGVSRIDPFALGDFSFATNEKILGVDFSGPMKYYYVLIAVMLAIIMVNVRLQNSRIGRAWEAIREDEIAARATGINTTAIKLLAFAMGATFGGVAGGMFSAIQGFISPESFVLVESVMVVAMVVLGGMGNIPGVILGAVLLSFVPEILRWTVEPVQRALFGKMLVEPEVIRMLLFGFALVLVMLFRPAGLLPSAVRKRELTGGAP
ncbi:MAG: hypothetical protein EXR31_01605 [Betaproteobacteria bacterium]|nr:hypothetical protein [Betaproteobacteria bacterium]